MGMGKRVGSDELCPSWGCRIVHFPSRSILAGSDISPLYSDRYGRLAYQLPTSRTMPPCVVRPSLAIPSANSFRRVAIEIATLSLLTLTYEFATKVHFHLATIEVMLSVSLPLADDFATTVHSTSRWAP